uniref:Putative secreted protein n=1 Tax=Anopheles marajoara TaxID=58244 RepID=A0A2M4C6Y5_9DIPT
MTRPEPLWLSFCLTMLAYERVDTAQAPSSLVLSVSPSAPSGCRSRSIAAFADVCGRGTAGSGEAARPTSSFETRERGTNTGALIHIDGSSCDRGLRFGSGSDAPQQCERSAAGTGVGDGGGGSAAAAAVVAAGACMHSPDGSGFGLS